MEKNLRKGEFIGTFRKSFGNYSKNKESGQYFTAGLIDVTLETDRDTVLVKFKAFGEFAKCIINNAKDGSRVRLEGVVFDELKKQAQPEIGYQMVLVLSEKNGAKVEFLK